MLYPDAVRVAPQLYCDNDWLMSDVCLSSGCQSCDEHDLCPGQDIEKVIDYFSAMMRGAIRMCNSSIGVDNEFACGAESLDQEVCCEGIFLYK